MCRSAISPVPVHHYIQSAIALLRSGQGGYPETQQVFNQRGHAIAAETAALGAGARRMGRNPLLRGALPQGGSYDPVISSEDVAV